MSLRNEWISIKEMTELYGVSPTLIYVKRHNEGGVSWLKKSGKRTIVNVGYLRRLRKLRISLQQEAEDLYFEFESERAKFTRFLTSNSDRKSTAWGAFITKSLFRVRSKPQSIVSTFIGEVLVDFVRLGRRYKRLQQ